MESESKIITTVEESWREGERDQFENKHPYDMCGKE